MKKLQDNVNNPLHYNQFGIECLDAIQASMSAEEFKGYLKGNTIKYLWRYTYKGKPVEDLLKGQYYYNKLIKVVQDAPTAKEHHRDNRKDRRKVRSKPIKTNTKKKHTTKKRFNRVTAGNRR